MNTVPPIRRTKAGGAKKRPSRYDPAAGTPPELAAALRAHRQGHWGEAIVLYQARLARAPDCLDSCMNLAALFVLAGRARDAGIVQQRALARAPRDARVQRDVAIGMAAVGRLEEARAAFERAVGLDATLVGAHLGLCRVAADLGDDAGSVRHGRRAVALAPAEASTHLEFHRVLFDDRCLGPCIEAAHRAVELDPDYALARLFLSGALALDGRRAEAAAALGPSGLVADGLGDALAFAVEQQSQGARVFGTKAQTLRHALDHCRLPGPVLEFGVRHGVSTRLIATGLAGELHGFDSFVGLPESWQGRDAGAFSTAGELPDVPANVTLHVGSFQATLPAFVARLRQPPRLIHIDSDLYSSALTVLETLGPRIVPGCVLLFDELLGNASWRDDEFRAFREASTAFSWKSRALSASWITGQAAFEIV